MQLGNFQNLPWSEEPATRLPSHHQHSDKHNTVIQPRATPLRLGHSSFRSWDALGELKMKRSLENKQTKKKSRLPLKSKRQKLVSVLIP